MGIFDSIGSVLKPIGDTAGQFKDAYLGNIASVGNFINNAGQGLNNFGSNLGAGLGNLLGSPLLIIGVVVVGAVVLPKIIGK